MRPSPRSGSWLRALAVGVALAVAFLALAQAPGPVSAQRLTEITAMSRADQRAADVQRDLTRHFRQGTVLYLHHLDKLAARPLFSLGDETRFVAAVGSTDGTDHNRVFIEGQGAPYHRDGGEYVLPIDFQARYPLSPTRNTCWHEVQHALLDTAGVGINPRPYAASMDQPSEATGLGSFTSMTVDYHHPIIEGVGQRGAEAYGRLYAFEEAARAAHAEQQAIEKSREPTFAEIRHVWSLSHQRFSQVSKAWQRVARVPAATVGAYRTATGIFFSPPEDLATFYREGGLKTGGTDGQNVGDDVRVPKWVFYPTLARMPVRIHVIEGAHAPPGKENDLTRTFTVSVEARGSVHEVDARPKLTIADISRPLKEGTLTVTLEGGDEQAVVRVDLPKGTVRDVSARHREVKLNGEAMTVTFHVADLRRTPEKATYTIRLAFADDLREPLFDTSERRIEIEVDPPDTGRQAAASPGTAPGRAVPEPDPRDYHGYWELTAVDVDDTNRSESGSRQTLTLGRGRAGVRKEYTSSSCAASFTWAEPAARYAVGESFALVMDMTLDEYQHLPSRMREFKPVGGCRIEGELIANERSSSDANRVSGKVQVNNHGVTEQGSAHLAVTWVFPPPHPARTDVLLPPSGVVDLEFHVSSGSVGYRYVWVNEPQDETEVRVHVPDAPSDAAPVPPPYDGAPIGPEEITGPRPPVVPPDDGVPPRVRPTLFQPPGGDYRIVLPSGWVPLARVDGEYLYVAPHNAYVLACPSRARRYRGTFADQRPSLASELLRREIGGDALTPTFGRHEGLVVSVVEQGRDTTRVFVASEGRAVGFRVIAAAGVEPPLPSVLEEAFATVEWVEGGPVTTRP